MTLVLAAKRLARGIRHDGPPVREWRNVSWDPASAGHDRVRW
jgi:hypothetical protein